MVILDGIALRVDDDVRHQTVFVERHVDLWKHHTDDTLLRMTTLHFVTDVGNPCLTDLDFAELVARRR